MNDLFANRVAVVTGSALGIGRGVCEVLAARGVQIAALDIDVENNAQTAENVRAAGAQCLALECDVGDRVAVKTAIDTAANKLGRIDMLINNAGFWDNSALTQGDYDSQTAAFDQAMQTTAMGSYYCTRAAVDHLRAAGGGNVIGMITDHIKEEFYLAATTAVGYDGAKFAMWRQTEAWAAELAPHHIRVNGLCFGAVNTPMLRGVVADPLPGEMQPQDIGQAVVNVVAQGVQGADAPTGQSWLICKTPESREVGLREIAALAP